MGNKKGENKIGRLVAILQITDKEINVTKVTNLCKDTQIRLGEYSPIITSTSNNQQIDNEGELSVCEWSAMASCQFVLVQTR